MQTDGCATEMPVISAITANPSAVVVAGEKSDSGFWSQSYDSYRASMAVVEGTFHEILMSPLCGGLLVISC